MKVTAPFHRLDGAQTKKSNSIKAFLEISFLESTIRSH